MKRLLSLLLVLAMSLSLLCTVSAASPEATEAADALHDLGLFQGVGTNQDGTPNYDLDRAPNRYEAVTMLVRLLGKEEEAKTGTWNTPFTDVAEWAKPYVGYAYENGLTNGISADKFGGTNLVTASQYITFVLRALGYDSSSDFKWDAAWELSDKLSITTGQYNSSSAFTRGDVAIISNRALDVAIVDSNDTLLGLLERTGAVPYRYSTIGRYVSLAKYQGKIYSLVPQQYSVISSHATREPYIPMETFNYNSLFFIFQDLRTKENNNQFTDGTLYPNDYYDSYPYAERGTFKFNYTCKDEYISLNNFIFVFSLQSKGKTFESMNAEAFITAGLTTGMSEAEYGIGYNRHGVWDGVRYIVNYFANPTIYYNMNDIAKYFGVDRTFHIEYDGNEAYLIIE